jgi:dTDP-4-dehydrorhamnose 3,5-epimerase
MLFLETKLKDAYIVDVEPRGDDRGFFARAWCAKEFEAHGLATSFVQCNLAFNEQRGTLRGMHFQRAPHAEVKLIRCVRGALLDVLIDLRPDSPTYMDWVGVELTEDNRRMLYAPEGTAHGYLTLADQTEAFYQVSAFYAPEAEGGVRWDDPAFAIEWPEPPRVLSDKDRAWPDYVAERVPALGGAAKERA